jgi:hypothetical protein
LRTTQTAMRATAINHSIPPPSPILRTRSANLGFFRQRAAVQAWLHMVLLDWATGRREQRAADLAPRHHHPRTPQGRWPLSTPISRLPTIGFLGFLNWSGGRARVPSAGRWRWKPLGGADLHDARCKRAGKRVPFRGTWDRRASRGKSLPARAMLRFAFARVQLSGSRLGGTIRL